MNNKDYLSQEEIDALLKRAAEDEAMADVPDLEAASKESGNGLSSAVSDYLDSMEQDALGEIGNITFGSAATALSTLLGKKVEITTPKVSVVLQENLLEEFPKPYVAVHVNFVEGFQGINLLVIKTADAKVIADLMLGGSGEVDPDEELNDIHISAVQEAMNQMMGSSATSMSTIFNRFVNISPPGIDILNLPAGEGADSLPDEQVFIKVSFRLTIGDLIDSTIMQLLPVDFAKEMVHSLMSGGSQDQMPKETSHAQKTPVTEGSQMVDPVPNKPNPDQLDSQPSVQHEPMPNQQPYQPSYQQQAMPNPAYQEPSYSGAHQGIQRNVNVQPVQYADLNPMASVHADTPNLDLLLDIPLKVTVELGRTKKLIKEILELSQGSIIELDKLAGEPVDILVNNKLIAKGEVVVIDENFGVRVTDIISQRDRIIKLQ
ncbi:flagellar motor switch phosphatase FliY [Insulibacter thermoxylanivorax]|uniref:Flagellar motor switch phosphatase FliY n=1 Tax=Insulibacter thermoxylanivorax TaxID=2749268 RepID=A0A916QBJ6_9BACL|nr:flagellar motor switch phosphatase FliY [Insulibacter thermoxylanivorax]GFR37720.1 flagellar motor switch phosphatase FliY [Insulibacter thermoxylanivorax]